MVFHFFYVVLPGLQGHVDQWIDFASLEVDANLMLWLRPRMGYAVYLPPVGQHI